MRTNSCWVIGAAISLGLTLGAASHVQAAIINGTVTVSTDSVYGIDITGGTTTAVGNPSGSTISSSVNGGGGSNSSPPAETANFAIDQNIGTKYLNFEGVTASTSAGTFGGLIVTPSAGPTALTSFTLTSANDSADRDPKTITIEGTNTFIAANSASGTNGPSGNTITAAWTPIYSGASGLTSGMARLTAGATEPIVSPALGFTSYRVLVTSTFGDPSETCCFQFAEINLVGSTVPEPISLGGIGIAGAAVLGLLKRRRAAR